jgi:hypothetical protein
LQVENQLHAKINLVPSVKGAPINVTATVISASFTYGLAPTIHKKRFMDQLHKCDMPDDARRTSC